jgi:hypothetical protein
VKLWAKSATADDFSLLIELRLNFKSLQFIGKEVFDSQMFVGKVSVLTTPSRLAISTIRCLRTVSYFIFQMDYIPVLQTFQLTSPLIPYT